jgi:hypothetical protein
LKQLCIHIALCTGMLASAAPAAHAAQVWVAPAAQKVRPGTATPAQAPTQAALYAAQNEFESFHVVVTGAASGVSMSLPALSDGNGHTISGRDLVLYREALLNVSTPTGADGAAGPWPDALVPDVDPIVSEKRSAFPFDVPAGESRAVLVDVHVPASTPAGVYTGTLVVSGGASAQVPVSVTVWDFALPSTATLRSAFGLSWNTPCGGHWGDWSCTDPRAWALRTRYLQAALDNRISLDTPAIGGPVAANGTADWSAFDAQVGPLLDGLGPTRLQGARLTSVRIQTSNGVASTAQVAGYAQHFRARGWLGTLYNYVCDEPPATCNFSDIDPRIAQAVAGDASVPNLVTTSIQLAQQNGVKRISLYAPVVNWMDDKPQGQYPGSQRALYPPTVWWYQSCASWSCGPVDPTANGYASGWPSMAVDTDGSRNRALEWLSFLYGISGELYYETTNAYYAGNPWTDQYDFGGTGDGNLFYPGTPARIGGQTDIPIESLRMKGIRDGMEDYELLALAKSLGATDQAIAIARGVFARTYQAVATPAALDAARAQLAALILHALGKDTIPSGTPDAGTPPADAGTPDAGTPQPDAGTPDAGTPAPDAGSNPAPGPADGGASVPPTTQVALGSIAPFGRPAHQTSSGGGGAMRALLGASCSSAGATATWLGLPLLALQWLRRRRSRRGANGPAGS